MQAYEQNFVHSFRLQNLFTLEILIQFLSFVRLLEQIVYFMQSVCINAKHMFYSLGDSESE